MFSQILIGLFGGLITGVSPCILPMLPIIFLAGATGASSDGKSPSRKYPLLITLGLVVSFTAVTLLGSTVLSLLGLPQDFIRWTGIAFLVLIGVSLMIPKVEEWLEKPFARIRMKQVDKRSNGFVFGLVLGTAYVPCAGPVLTAISVAGSTGKVGAETVALAISFAVGVAIPLFFFALAGRGVTERVKGYRKRQRGIRIAAGGAMIALAAGIVFDLPAKIQRVIPDYTANLQKAADEYLHDEQSGKFTCSPDSAELADCGPQPEITGIAAWFNTPGGRALEHKAPAGGVRLVDFWAYSCINCQRSVPGIEKLYKAYRDYGLQVIGIHSPEYAFEKVPENVKGGAQKLGITYPVAVDSDLKTWSAFDNHYWPAHYLVDAQGKVRHIHYGEHGEARTERLIRELLAKQNPGKKLPDPVFSDKDDSKADAARAEEANPETYLFPDRARYYDGKVPFAEGTVDYGQSSDPKPGKFNLSGKWTADGESATPAFEGASLKLGLHSRRVYLVASGKGEITYTFQGRRYTKKVEGIPNAIDLLPGDNAKRGTLTVEASAGVRLHSFTFG